MPAAVRCLGLVSLALLAGCGNSSGSPPQPDRPGDPRLGRQVAVRKCTLCHTIDGRGGVLAPPLEESAATAAKLVADYPARAKALEESDPKTYRRSAGVIEAIAAEPDLAKRYLAWLRAYLPDPRFDNPQARMGAAILTPQELEDVLAWLATLRPAR